MNYSDVIVMLARQRSGTNAVRSVLQSNPDVCCFAEVFWLNGRKSRHEVVRRVNFFNFIQQYAKGDVRRLFPDRHERLFLDFLEYLRCFTSKRYILIDVKYNMTHFFTKPWADNLTSPYLLDLITSHQLHVLNITRKNYLRYMLSELKAYHTGRYSSRSEGTVKERRIFVETREMFGWFTKCQDEDTVIQRQFQSYPHFRSYEYADLFSLPTGEVAFGFLEALARWLDLPETFSTVPEYKKQSYLPLAETIENYDEVAAALTGTEYEHFLEDEPVYRHSEGNPSPWVESRH